MQYLCLIYDAESVQAKNTDAQNGELFAAYGVFSKDLQEAGAMVGGEALEPSTTATTVRVRDGKVLKTDGPFAETKEQLGGYYLVEAKDLDEALKWAAKIPNAKTGCVEVRPIMVFDM